MTAPPLYSVMKFAFKDIIRSDFNISLTAKEEKPYIIQQQDNQLFRLIRLITKDDRKYNKYIVFVDIRSGKNDKETLSKLITDGFILNNKKYVMSERSASMTRNSMLSFVRENISDELNERVSLGKEIGNTVLSKYVAYRGLVLSSCHCIENWLPKIIIVPDCYKTVKNQHIKYLSEKDTEIIDKETGEKKIIKEKCIRSKKTDYEINVFDGAGICHPNIPYQVQDKLGIEELPTTIMIRMPFIKGIIHSMDYTTFYKERGIEHIVDIWGNKHSVEEIMIIINESMYKGFKYFKNKNTIDDWYDYLDRFKRYNHCIGISKWNFTLEQEPLYSRVNYQILQDLNLPFEKFIKLAKYSVSWIEKVINGDKLYTYAFLGLTSKNQKPISPYMEALLLNDEMMKEEGVRKYLIASFRKYIDGMKFGKLWVKATYKILTPDLIMFLEFIGGLPLKGCLKDGQFYTRGIEGVYRGEYLIERNPHITHSEHALLKATYNDKIARYCSHLTNICMVNGDSLILQRLNGADCDKLGIQKKGLCRTI